MHHKGPAIVLRRIPYGESDQIVTFLSQKEGRLSGIAKGAKRSVRRFGAGLEPGSIVEMSYTHRLSSKLVRLESSHVLVATTGFTTSLSRIGAGTEALEIALSFLQEHQPEEKKFELLTTYFTKLSSSDPTPFDLAKFQFDWLSLSGYAPLFDRCVGCGVRHVEKEQVLSYSYEPLGFSCSRCRSPEHVRVSAELRHALFALGNSLPPHISFDWLGARNLLRFSIQQIIGRPLKSSSINALLERI